MQDFKNKAHKFLQDEENLKKYLPKYINTPAKNIIKNVSFEIFKYNIQELKNNISEEIEENQTIILFEYGAKGIFEKAKTYEVELKEDLINV